MFLPILLVSLLTVTAQPPQNELFQDAVRAFQEKDYATARMLFEAVVSSDPRNQPAQNYLRAIAKIEKGGGGMEASLKRIVLPKLEFNEVTAREAMAYVVQQVDKQTGGKEKVNLVWMVPDGQARSVTLSMQQVPASEAFRYIAEIAGLALAYDVHALKVTPAQVP